MFCGNTEYYLCISRINKKKRAAADAAPLFFSFLMDPIKDRT